MTRGNHARVIIVKGKHIENCSILVADCFTVRKVILMAIPRNIQIQTTIIQNDSQAIVRFYRWQDLLPKGYHKLSGRL